MEALGLVESVESSSLVEPEACQIDASGPTESQSRYEVFNSFCQDPKCIHPLTVHTRGLTLHGRCLVVGCKCLEAKLTEAASKRVSKGVMA